MGPGDTMEVRGHGEFRVVERDTATVEGGEGEERNQARNVARVAQPGGVHVEIELEEIHVGERVVELTRGDGEAADIFKGDGAIPETKINASRLEDQQTELEKYLEAGLTVESKQQVLIKAEVGCGIGTSPAWPVLPEQRPPM